MTANHISDYIIQQILIRSDVKDLMRCRGVCKSWHSLISSPYFAESYLKHIKDPEQLTQRITGEGSLRENRLFVVGSANGLVCVSPEGFQLLVVNPCTRQAIKILEPPPEPYLDGARRLDRLVWGFGYDSFNNDYNIVVGNVTAISTRFYVLSLRTCLWKFFIEYESVCTNCDSVSGILCNGKLHWVMKDPQNQELAIFSFNLSREEFISIRLPDGHSVFQRGTRYTLGVMEGSLCLYVVRSPYTEIWVLKSDTEHHWEMLPDDYVIKYEAVYLMNEDDYSIPDTPELLNPGKYIGAHMYVRSLVSPYHVKHMESSSKSLVIPMAKKNVIVRRVRRTLIRHCHPLLVITNLLGILVAASLLDTPSVNQRKLIRRRIKQW
uniref:F-box/kelch-repeat protein At3g06240-like n=1 Tax=Erigeron canadensis TaxID=72917 RepID=UPI001CB9B741|nr:F-box/kelch-repeat protein At3g06240-like [Erigeron canadensis]